MGKSFVFRNLNWSDIFVAHAANVFHYQLGHSYTHALRLLKLEESPFLYFFISKEALYLVSICFQLLKALYITYLHGTSTTIYFNMALRMVFIVFQILFFFS